ncbi:MerR family transcriptional regulator [Sulfurifustis variabilis]|uniref:MerR family transcriptional regulator n=1 Tax=Sulfurifustis variabilis TaxID=1675686 RepID=A0A1B4VBM5_9GAMM|nr:MerR family transcriptional regulator [Sulfurifustis variabilis]BAU49824.1 MerR family transcriptional regulator [Sulfurifustis variabilis]
MALHGQIAATVNSVAHAAAVPPHVVRYYVRIGLLRPQRNPANGYRLFPEPQLRRLKFIRRAQALGYSLDEIRRLLACAERGRAPCPEARAIVEPRLREAARHARELTAVRRRAERAVRLWHAHPGGAPDGNDVGGLITALTED